MKKAIMQIFWIIIVFALIIGLIVPLIFGFIIKNQFAEHFLNFAQSPSVQAKIVHYERGWFTSTATIELTLKNSQLSIGPREASSNKLIINENIKHGLLIFNQESGLKIALASIVANANSANIDLTGNVVWLLNQQVKSSFNAPKLQFIDQNTIINVQEIQGNYLFNPKLMTIIGQTNINKIDSNSPDATTVSISGFSAQQKLQRKNLIWYGTRDLQVKYVSLTNKGTKSRTYVANNISLSANVTELNNKTQIAIVNNVKTINFNGTTLGPLDLIMSVQNIDSQSLSDFIAKAQSFDPQDYKNKMSDFSNSLFQLVSKGINVNIDKLQLETPQGSVQINAGVSLPEMSSSNIFSLLYNLQIQMNVKIPQVWLVNFMSLAYENSTKIPQGMTNTDYAKQQVQQWINDKQWLLDANGILTMNLQLQKAKLLMNGIPIKQAPTN